MRKFHPRIILFYFLTSAAQLVNSALSWPGLSRIDVVAQPIEPLSRMWLH